MRIGLLGLTFNAGNKGCEALSYSFLEILNNIANKRNEIIDVDILYTFPTRKFIKSKFRYKKCIKEFMPDVEYSNLKIDFCFYYHNKKNLNSYPSPRIKKCNFIFDFTAGDSFADLYGRQRFFAGTKFKKKIIDMGIPLVLGSQTIGPFKDDDVRKFAVEVIKESKEVYVRDEMSLNYTREISGREAKLTTDIAFELPYDDIRNESDKIKVGINPSGLLWNAGNRPDCSYKLSVDYKEYCRKLITTLLEDGNYEVHIIPHAFSLINKSVDDNDYAPVEQLKKEFPEVKFAPYCNTPMQVKGYIASMDVFTGARMHATIGAFSAGIADIPFSYSRKFEGLYNSLDYKYVVHGCTDTTEEALSKTLQWIKEYKTLQQSVKISQKIIKTKMDYLYNDLTKLLYN